MVRLEEVEDEEFMQSGERGFVEDDEDFTDTESELSEDDEESSALSPESIIDRVSALRDIIPPATRRQFSSTFSTASTYVKSGLWLSGKAAWIVSTSALLWGIPFALALVEEQQIAEMEREQKMREMGNEVLVPGSTSQPLPGQASAAL